MDQTTSASVDPKSGFNRITKIFHSLRPTVDLPSEDASISVADYALSSSPDFGSLALIDSSSGHGISYSDFYLFTKSLTCYLHNVIKLSKNDVAFVLCPKSTKIPILYFSLLSLGVIISPSNPLNTELEISRQISLSKPVIAFATSSTAHKIPKLNHKTILLDSPEFNSILTTSCPTHELDKVTVRQSDLAGIFYSSGTTGKVKAVMLTHRNLTAVVGGYLALKQEKAVTLNPVPYFHVYGFFYSLKSVALREVVVVMEKFELKKMLRAVQEFRVTQLAVAPPIVVQMVKDGLTDCYDLRSLQAVGCGAAPLGRDVIAAFKARFPTVELWQGYGLTESSGVCSRATGPGESHCWGSVGRLTAYCKVKIVNPDTMVALLPGKQGELWIKGPTIMKGYVGDPEATSAALTSDGWLRTGDLCYIDEEGFVFIVDRLKELIKYKGYQVAPAELEQLLLSHPEIADAAVIPYPNEEAGQIPIAFIVKQPQSSLNEKDIMDFVAKQVAPYKKIRRVAFVNSIPKSPSGKILRKDLRDMILPAFASRM
ncbi:4-coumarate--CoA ligase-like 9 [Ricinus communis]|uniref:AMP dependent CoA ligase, putative n=1 Tax=Ricinus communis TaxID=3988 RepID=B9RBM4_RICCO|nr:4-coumarate--CoA ligase-like 9 [Ricinus communis]EEF50945.1 AMP dependent CoA ligase, putative [Ricinus communis]|eukprot:XP_002509558.1 4-coumarate--CoA ligase-like 9 [Ricinus communis]